MYSHPSEVDFVAQAKALGYEVVMVFMHLEQPSLNLARISQRVQEGGHAVPAQKVISRIPMLMQHVRASLSLCDVFRAYDNRCVEQPFLPIFSLMNGRLEHHCEPLPAWALDLLAAT